MADCSVSLPAPSVRRTMSVPTWGNPSAPSAMKSIVTIRIFRAGSPAT